MPKNINSASRLFALLKSIPAHTDNTQTLEVWAKLFGINDANPHKKAALVAERLGAMRRELELVTDQMQRANFSEDLYAQAVSQVENFLSTMLLSGTWNQARQYLTAETFVALSFCGEILADEESLITAETLASIEAHVRELEESLNDSELPPSLGTLIRHHIELIRRALAEYPIAGAKALRESARTALGEFVEARETVQASRDAPQVSKLGSVWKQINEAADIALKGQKIAQLGQKAWELLGGLF